MLNPPSTNVLSNASFATVFKSHYSRVNKANGIKNVRCFPHCLEKGHKTDGFCGQAVILNLAAMTLSLADDFSLLAMFCPSNAPVDPFLIYNELEHTKADISEGKAVFMAYGWRYGWISSRSRCRIPHIFRVVAVSKRSNKVVGAIDSTPFLVSSSRSDRITNGAQESLAPSTLLAQSPHLREATVTVLRAMHERVHSLRDYDDDVSFADSDDDSADRTTTTHCHKPSDLMMSLEMSSTHSMALSFNTEHKLLALERLDALLARLVRCLVAWLAVLDQAQPEFADLVGLKMDTLLAECEDTTLEQLARDVLALVPLPPQRPPPAFFITHDNMDYWLQLSIPALDQFVTLADGFVLGGPNDVTGVWRRPDFQRSAMDHHRSMLGHTFVERTLWDQVEQDLLRLKVTAPNELISVYGVKTLGPQSSKSTRRTGQPSTSMILNPLLFPSATPYTGFFFATTLGTAQMVWHSPSLRQVVLFNQRPDKQILTFKLILQRLTEGNWELELELSTDFDRAVVED